MTTYTMNQVIETLAPVIADKLNLRAVIDYDGREGVLIDFSTGLDPFEDDTVMVWSCQADIYDEEGHYRGTDEVAYGSATNYMDAFNTVLALLNKDDHTVAKFYAETF